MEGYSYEELYAAMKLKNYTLRSMAKELKKRLGRPVNYKFISRLINDKNIVIRSPKVSKEIVTILNPELDGIKKVNRGKK